jgi:hypothetical protein
MLKAIQILVGVLTAIFAGFHAIGLILMIAVGETAGKFTATIYGARIAGICFGSAISIACFRAAFSKTPPNPQPDRSWWM